MAWRRHDPGGEEMPEKGWEWVGKEVARDWPEGIPVLTLDFRGQTGVALFAQVHFRPDWLGYANQDTLFCKVELPERKKK